MVSVFFFNDTATTEIYTLSLHDALPISVRRLRTGLDLLHRPDDGLCGERQRPHRLSGTLVDGRRPGAAARRHPGGPRSEEHTSELQSRQYLVCRLLLEKKKEQHL